MPGKPTPITCESCGARLTGGADVCDLCGAAVHPVDRAPQNKAVPAETGRGASPDVGTCSVCSASNPPTARFCNQCGARLQPGVALRPSDETAVPESEEGDEPAVRSGLYMAVGAVVAVLLLFGITLLSKDRTPPPAMTPPSEAAMPELSTALPADIRRQADDLYRRIEGAPDQITELDLRQELVSLYRDSGRFDLAAEAQRPVAEALESAYAWAYLGDLYYEHMLSRDAAHAQQVAGRAISAFEQSLEIDPENLDVRTHLAVAYLYDPVNPMRAVDEINFVLERDPDHVQANYNRGMMFAQIGRYEEAARQFERVADLTEEGTAAHDRAIDALRSIQNLMQMQ